MKKNEKKVDIVLEEIAGILTDVSKDEGLYVNYAKIYYGAMKFLQDLMGEKKIEFPIDVNYIYEKLNISIQRENLNEFMGDGDPQKVNRIIGKISIRPDYGNGGSKKSIYVDEKAAPAMVNYALAHELAHLIMNYNKKRYTDEYCIMPMLPKMLEEAVADAFAVFILIPFNVFIETFKDYILKERDKGNTPITTEDWLNYLGSVAAVPYYYVACAYQQMRHVAYLMHYLHIIDDEKRRECEEKYGKEVMEI